MGEEVPDGDLRAIRVRAQVALKQVIEAYGFTLNE